VVLKPRRAPRRHQAAAGFPQASRVQTEDILSEIENIGRTRAFLQNEPNLIVAYQSQAMFWQNEPNFVVQDARKRMCG
jgi:hypothetical protein